MLTPKGDVPTREGSYTTVKSADDDLADSNAHAPNEFKDVADQASDRVPLQPQNRYY